MPVARCQCKKQSFQTVGDGIVRVSLEKKGRGGKTVSLVTGLAGPEDEIRILSTELKRRCGTGGTVKDRTIEIQGDHRDLIIEILLNKRIKAKRVGG
jgi:translation initiation factor 1